MASARLVATLLFATAASFAAQPQLSSPVVNELKAALGPRAKDLPAAAKAEELAARFAADERPSTIERLDALDRSDFTPADWSDLSRAFAALGAHEKAAQAGLSLQALEPGKTDGYVLASAAYYQIEDYESTARIAERALTEHPGDKTLLAILHQSKDRRRASSSPESTRATVAESDASIVTAGARPFKLAVKVKPADAPPGLAAEAPSAPSSGGIPWLPAGAGVALIGYGVARSRGTWSKEESEALEDESPNSERLRTNRRHLKIAAASVIVGFAVAYGPAAVRVAAPAAVKIVQGANSSLQRVAASNAGAVFPEDQVAAHRVSVAVRGITISSPPTASRFFEGTKYSQRVLSQMSGTDYHAFPEIVRSSRAPDRSPRSMGATALRAGCSEFRAVTRAGRECSSSSANPTASSRTVCSIRIHEIASARVS